jgi:hypothetical protein
VLLDIYHENGCNILRNTVSAAGEREVDDADMDGERGNDDDSPEMSAGVGVEEPEGKAIEGIKALDVFRIFML